MKTVVKNKFEIQYSRRGMSTSKYRKQISTLCIPHYQETFNLQFIEKIDFNLICLNTISFGNCNNY